MAIIGRPTKYNPKYIAEVDAYLEDVAGREQMHLPKIESFALRIGVNKTTLYEWAKQHPAFSNALEKIMLRQAQQLIDDGIYGGKEVNATIVKLLLMNNHGMKERRDETSDDKPLTPFSDDQIDRIAERITRRRRATGDPAGENSPD